MTPEVIALIALVAIVIVGGCIVVFAGDWFVGWSVDRCLGDQLDDDRGIEGAGRAIGWAERTLIYVFILADAATAIGLLIAAKSILRIGDITNNASSDDDPPSGPRARTEYVIFGTLASFAWGVSIAFLMRWIVTAWLI